MKGNNLLVVGALCAFVLGVLKVISPLLYLVMDPNLHAEVPAAVFLPAFAAGPDALLAFFWVEALVGIFGIGLVPALSARVRAQGEGWVGWSANLASFGYGVSAVGYLLSIARLPLIAKTFVATPAAQPALAATWKASIDLLGVWGYAAIGFWILVVCLLARRSQVLPGWLVWLGVVVAVLHFAVPVGAYFKVQEVLMAIAVIGLALPVWYIGIGLELRKAAAKV